MAAALRAAASNRSPLGAALVMLWLPARSSCVIVPPATQVAVHSLRKHRETWQQSSDEPSILSLGQDSFCHTMLAGSYCNMSGDGTAHSCFKVCRLIGFANVG